MSVKPILFSTDMVEAILAGCKTQTRQVIKPKLNNSDFDYYRREGMVKEKVVISDGINSHIIAKCWHKPKYVAGDVLYVRETWARLECENCDTDPCPHDICDPTENISGGCYVYRATHDIFGDARWRPSIHMPRPAARIFLRVVAHRAARLQEISVQDALEEGIRVHANGCIDGLHFGCYNGDKCYHNLCTQPITYFRELWDSIYSKRGYGWDTNPWVFVSEFERIKECEVPK